MNAVLDATRASTVGLLGVGRMGLPIALQLLDAGFNVIGYRRHSLDELVAAGGDAAESFEHVARKSDVVISLLPTADALFEAQQAMMTTMRPGSVFVDMATLGIAVKRQVRDVLATRDIAMLDCPISGGPMMLSRRENVVLGSGEPEAFERCRPFMETFSSNVLYIGAFGSGSKIKFIAQHLVAVHNLATAEVLRYAQRSGVDLSAVIAAIVPTVASSRFFEQRGPMMAQRRFLPAAGPIAMLAKDLPPVLDDAAEIGVSMPLLAAAHRYYAAAIEAGMGHLDVAAMIDAFDLTNVSEGGVTA